MPYLRVVVVISWFCLLCSTFPVFSVTYYWLLRPVFLVCYLVLCHHLSICHDYQTSCTLHGLPNHIQRLKKWAIENYKTRGFQQVHPISRIAHAKRSNQYSFIRWLKHVFKPFFSRAISNSTVSWLQQFLLPAFLLQSCRVYIQLYVVFLL